MVGFTHMHPDLPIMRSLIIFYIHIPIPFPSSLKGCLQLVRSFGRAYSFEYMLFSIMSHFPHHMHYPPFLVICAISGLPGAYVVGIVGLALHRQHLFYSVDLGSL